jgi:hypothetical protein
MKTSAGRAFKGGGASAGTKGEFSRQQKRLRKDAGSAVFHGLFRCADVGVDVSFVMANTSSTQINPVEIIINMRAKDPVPDYCPIPFWRVSYVTAVPYSTLHVL